MTGKPGMTHRRPRRTAVRRQIWQSIRILRRFTLPDLMRTIPEGVSYGNIRKFVKSLETHGVVMKIGNYRGGRPGSFQQYRLVIDVGPEYPTTCKVCKQPIAEPVCQHEKSQEEKEKEKNIHKATRLAAGGGS